eukprot:2530112-Rhodomonas_salina.2
MRKQHGPSADSVRAADSTRVLSETQVATSGGKPAAARKLEWSREQHAGHRPVAATWVLVSLPGRSAAAWSQSEAAR